MEDMMLEELNMFKTKASQEPEPLPKAFQHTHGWDKEVGLDREFTGDLMMARRSRGEGEVEP
jgi:hypothetical protein